jgi:hypothetical protein
MSLYPAQLMYIESGPNQQILHKNINNNNTISKTFRKYVSNIPGNHEVKELQKTAILGTARRLRKVLM